MSGRTKIVLVNGAIGVGKSWLCRQIALRVPERVKQVGFNDGLKDVVGRIVGLDLFHEPTYAAFKSQVWSNGKTGRELMIMVSEGSKEFHESIWVDRFLDRCQQPLQNKLILCDSFGFPIEHLALIANDSVDLLTVYIDDGKMTLEGDYRQFENDSRLDLSRHCAIRAASSDEALAKVFKALANRGWI